MKTRILIVDDEKEALSLMEELFERNGFETMAAQNGREALAKIQICEPDIMISDLIMPEMDGMSLLREVRDKYPDVLVIMNTAHGTVENAVEAMKEGARDYVLKPTHLDEILSKVNNFAYMKKLARENEELRKELNERYNFDNIIGRTPEMMQVFNLIRDVAPVKATVLIRGENGTGKELIARAIHYSSNRCRKPLVDINCGAVPENLLESELFGHVRGSFTGAIKDKVGRFEHADGGSIFLDEIGEISTNLQVKLLRVLQERQFSKVGSNEVTEVDVRVIAATNSNLEKAMQDGTFRQDLYFRLNVIELNVPPLRERRDDIPLLVAHFVEKHTKRNDKTINVVDDDMLEVLKAHEWPGNVRELENAIERAIVLSKSDTLTTNDLPHSIAQNHHLEPAIQFNGDQGLNDLMNLYEKRVIAQALKDCNGNKVKAAVKLRINRSTLMSKCKKYDL